MDIKGNDVLPIFIKDFKKNIYELIIGKEPSLGIIPQNIFLSTGKYFNDLINNKKYGELTNYLLNIVKEYSISDYEYYFFCININVIVGIESNSIFLDSKKATFDNQAPFDKVNFVFINCILPQITFELGEKSGNVLFINCKYNINSGNEFIQFQSGSLNNAIFRECEFYNIVLDNVNGESLQINNSEIESLLIQDCNIIQKVNIKNKTKIESINIRNSKMSDLTIIDEVSVDELKIDGCETLNSFEIISNNIIKSLIICNLKEINDFILIKGSSISNVFINNFKSRGITFCGKSKVDKIEIKYSVIDYLIFSETILSETLTLLSHVKIAKIDINMSRIHYFILLGNSVNLIELEIFENSFIERLLANTGSSFGNLKVSDSSISRMDLEYLNSSLICKNVEFGTIEISKCIFNKLEFHGTIFVAFFNMVESKIVVLLFNNALLKKDSIISLLKNEYYFVKFDNALFEGKLIVRGASLISNMELIKPIINENSDLIMKKLDLPINKKTLIIIDSSLGKSEISNCNFLEFALIFQDSKISDIHFINNELPEIAISNKLNLSAKILNNVISLNSQLRDLYLKAGDIEKVTKYHSKVLELNRLKLNKDKNVGFFSEKRFTKIQFWLNSKSNGFGLSWRKALYFTFKAGFIFYILFCVCYFIEIELDSRFKVELDFSYKNVQNSVLDYFRFLDLTHNLENFKSINSNTVGFALIFDFLGRIFISYGIFQFIAAFRRHGVKK